MKKLVFLLAITLHLNLYAQKPDYNALCEQSKKESLVPIHPGVPGKVAFWNQDPNARLFKYAPAFDFREKKGAVEYKFIAFSFTSKKEYTFTAKTPYTDLSPIWNDLPDGEISLKVEAIMENGFVHLCGLRSDNNNYFQKRNFYKVSPFCPPYKEAKSSYSDASLDALEYIFNLEHIKNWYHTGKPDHDAYFLYCYPAKILRGISEAMMDYYDITKNDTALVIAKKTADYIIANTEAADAPLAHFPQTYEGEGATARHYNDQIIMMEPAMTGPFLLNMYKKTNDKKYYNAAIKIADTYQKTQLSSGTWYIRVYKETGKPASDVLCIPINIARFLTILIEDYNLKKYKPTADRAIKWVLENPVKTYNWTGQFEDIRAAKPYQNHTKYEAGWTAWYLFDHQDENPSYLETAKELVAFCEDQFVLWEDVVFYDHRTIKTTHWHTPCAMEQYFCYVPIDASATMMIKTFYKAYEATGDIMYREKAITLTNSIVNVQKENGLIPTFWTESIKENWLNCMIKSARTLDFMDKKINLK